MKKFLSAVLVAFSLIGCASSPPAQPPAPIASVETAEAAASTSGYSGASSRGCKYNCTINVRSYIRKDGTRVRAHTRRK